MMELSSSLYFILTLRDKEATLSVMKEGKISAHYRMVTLHTLPGLLRSYPYLPLYVIIGFSTQHITLHQGSLLQRSPYFSQFSKKVCITDQNWTLEGVLSSPIGDFKTFKNILPLSPEWDNWWNILKNSSHPVLGVYLMPMILGKLSGTLQERMHSFENWDWQLILFIQENGEACHVLVYQKCVVLVRFIESGTHCRDEAAATVAYGCRTFSIEKSEIFLIVLGAYETDFSDLEIGKEYHLSFQEAGNYLKIKAASLENLMIESLFHPPPPPSIFPVWWRWFYGWGPYLWPKIFIVFAKILLTGSLLGCLYWGIQGIKYQQNGKQWQREIKELKENASPSLSLEEEEIKNCLQITQNFETDGLFPLIERLARNPHKVIRLAAWQWQIKEGQKIVTLTFMMAPGLKPVGQAAKFFQAWLKNLQEVFSPAKVMVESSPFTSDPKQPFRGAKDDFQDALPITVSIQGWNND